MILKFTGYLCIAFLVAGCGGANPGSECAADSADCNAGEGGQAGEGGAGGEGGEGGDGGGQTSNGGIGGAAGSAGGASGGGPKPGGTGGANSAGTSGTGGMAGNQQGGAGGASKGGAGGSTGLPGDPSEPWQFLFVGNSFTFNSNIAGQTRDLVNKGQSAVRIMQSNLSVNWYRGLYYHWNFGDNVSNGNTLALIRGKTYTHVALQDFMLHPTAKSEINTQTGEGMYGADVAADYGKRFVDEIKKNGQVPIVWAIWPEQNKQSDWEALIQAYKKIAKDNGAVFVPASAAWLLALKERPTLPLWDADRFHPSPLGGYACACVFYAVLTGKSPVGNPHTGAFDEETARFLQEKAWQAYQMYGNP